MGGRGTTKRYRRKSVASTIYGRTPRYRNWTNPILVTSSEISHLFYYSSGASKPICSFSAGWYPVCVIRQRHCIGCGGFFPPGQTTAHSPPQRRCCRTRVENIRFLKDPDYCHVLRPS